jgi:hypothetical protein
MRSRAICAASALTCADHLGDGSRARHAYPLGTLACPARRAAHRPPSSARPWQGAQIRVGLLHWQRCQKSESSAPAQPLSQQAQEVLDALALTSTACRANRVGDFLHWRMTDSSHVGSARATAYKRAPIHTECAAEDGGTSSPSGSPLGRHSACHLSQPLVDPGHALTVSTAASSLGVTFSTSPNADSP